MNAAAEQNLIDRVEALGAECRERAQEIEQQRNLPVDIAESMSELGLFGLFAPKGYGGAEGNAPLGILLLETLARHESASAWCAMIGMTSAQTLGFLPEDAARTIFARPDTRISGVFAPRGTAVREGDQLCINGHWQWGSGTRNAHWVLAGVRVLDESGEPEMKQIGDKQIPLFGMAVVPAGGVQWDDNWHSLGLCGTGSSDFRIQDVRIPAGQLVDILGRRTVDAPLYRFPQMTLLATGIAAVALGIAEGALEESIAICQTKVRMGSSSAQAAKPSVQMALGEMHARLRAARTWLYHCLEDAWATVREPGGRASESQRRDLRLAGNLCTYTAVDATQLAYRQAGGDSVYKTAGLERRLRDVNVITQHVQMSQQIFEQGGRLLFELPTDTSML
ncbi:MAG: acyl-CoA dehydrogenase family protein [Gammaproteobacteria bacterium AqS3]|nr:acyl-CoA dehydrogenase family protein [Gammaproteobacteria bacterium AqS3]